MEKIEIHYDYSDAPTLVRFAKSNKFIRCVIGPFGSGKSSACVQEIIRRGHEQLPGKDGIRRTRWAVIRNTYPELRDTTVKTFHEWVPPNLFGTYNNQYHDYTIKGFPGVEIEILFRSLDNEGDIKKLLSMELTGAWVNEAREVPWSIIDALTGRVGRYPAMKDGGPTWYGVIMDTNPPDEESDIYRVFEEDRPENAIIFRQPSGLSQQAENLKHLVQGYYTNLCTGKSDEWIKVYVKGEYGFIIEGSPVYSEYNDLTHCNDKIKPVSGRTIRRGWDFGLTPACSFSQLQLNGQWYVFDELYASRMGIENFSKEVLDHCARNYADYKFEDYADPAGESASQTDERTCFQIMNAQGIYPKAGEVTLKRLESVRKTLSSMVDGKPMLQIHPRCKRLRKGFMGGYHYAERKNNYGELKPEPEKNVYSHIHDALQYDASRLFGAGLKPREKTKERYSKTPKGRTWASA